MTGMGPGGKGLPPFVPRFRAQPWERAEFEPEINSSGMARLVRGDGLLVCIVHLEYRGQFGDCQNTPQARSEAGQLDVRARRPRRRIHSDQGSETAAVDVTYAA